MGKAIYGRYGGIDPRTQAEVLALRAKVRELEAELAEVRATAAARMAPDLDAPMIGSHLDLALLTSSGTALV
ncbi:MAG: hypothetical protein WCF36_20175 [Candidatus Nanopelagicales bacterium]